MGGLVAIQCHNNKEEGEIISSFIFWGRIYDRVPFRLTLKMVGPLIVRLGGKAILGRGNNEDKRPEERGSMLCSGKNSSGTQYVLGMRGDKWTRRVYRDLKDGQEKAEDKLQVGGHVGM